MLSYSVWTIFPNLGTDSVLMFLGEDLFGCYRISRKDPCEVLTVALDLEMKGFNEISPEQAEDYIRLRQANKQYESSKNLFKKISPINQKDLVTLAYNASKKNFEIALRSLSSSSDSDSLDDIYDQKVRLKEEAEAMFKVIEQVYFSFGH